MMTVKEFKIQLALGSLSDDMKLKLAENKRTSKRILTILSTDEDWGIRWDVADNTNTPIEVLTILSKDKQWNVRYRVVNNPNTPVGILTKLSKDKDKDVRRGVAENLKERNKEINFD